VCGGVLVLQNGGTGVYIWGGCCLASLIECDSEVLALLGDDVTACTTSAPEPHQ
jgi:hypothetical protein